MGISAEEIMCVVVEFSEKGEICTDEKGNKYPDGVKYLDGEIIEKYGKRYFKRHEWPTCSGYQP